MANEVYSPFVQATQKLGLSPQEQYLYYHHLNNLYGEGKVVNPGGQISTIEQAVVSGPGGLYYNIPTVWDGQKLDIETAKQRARQVGYEKFPAYATPEQADLRYSSMHDFLEQDTEAYQRTGR